MQMTGAQLLVQSLVDQGSEVIFGYPGGQVINIYDALYERRDVLRHVVVSHEQGAAHAADGYARSSGKTGVLIATSGPGATNIVTGIATAYLDSVPLVAITGNVSNEQIGRDSFQEIDIVTLTNPVTKHNYIVRDIKELEQTVKDAFMIANSGRKGPVLIDIPKDVTVAYAEYQGLSRFTPRPSPTPDEDLLLQVAYAIKKAKRPLLFAGGGVTFSGGSAALRALSEKIGAPVCTSMMGISSISTDSPLCLGMLGMHGSAKANIAVDHCDLLIALGVRFSDRVAGNRMKFAKDAFIVHIDIDDTEFEKNIHVDIPITGDVGACLERLVKLTEPKKHDEWLAYIERKVPRKAKTPQKEHLICDMIAALRDYAGDDAIVATDVGQHQMFTAQHYRFTEPRSFLSSCGLGTMGYGMGAANGAKIANPDRPVVLVTGDGSFHMNMGEFAVAVSENLPIVVLLMNNGVLGMVHQWQKLFFKGRYSNTEIERKTDFVKMAEAFGGVGFRIREPQDVEPVLKKAFAQSKPCIVECIVSREERVFPIIPPGGSSEDILYSED